ncbi:MAG: hypothetical protein ACPGJV_08725 [Bacteriovoracaceae bacterium]
MNWLEQISEESDRPNEVLSFHEYMEQFEAHPNRETRPTSLYLKDMLEHFGKTEDGEYTLFQTEHEEVPAVYGQKKPEEQIIQNLLNFKEEGFNNKFILLVGPNGSAKSSLVRKIMMGAEDYSSSDQGKLFTFSWIFPIDNYIKGTLGLTSTPTGTNLSTYAHLADKEISAILNSDLKDHPLLLIPLKARQKIIKEALADDPEQLEAVKKSYLYRGDLSKRNRMIYEALLKNYKGDHKDVLKHIRVERFIISKRYSSSAVTIEPQMHVDAKMQQITMDKRLASLPPSLQSLNLFTLQGEAIMANRGVLEFSDLLKRPLDAFKYLLQTMETSNLNLQGIVTHLDIFFIGTSNEIHQAAFRQHPDFNSFKGRFNFIRVPYLLDHKSEEKIYEKQIEGLSKQTKFEPHAMQALCLFAIMSRIRACQSKNYKDKKLGSIVATLNPLEKATLLSSGEVPERLDSESAQILTQGISEIQAEYDLDNLYEGKFGLSPRDMKAVIYKLANRNKNISFAEVIEYLGKLILKKSEYDFLNMTPQGDYHHPARFLSLIQSHSLDQFDKELRDSLGLIDNRSYESFIEKYILNVSALIKGEKLKNPITDKFEAPDEYFMKEFESNIDLKEDAKKFRSHLISRLGAFSLDNPGKEIHYPDVFPDLISKLKESFRVEQKKTIQEIAKNIVFYEAEKNTGDAKTSLTKESREIIEQVIQNLTEAYGYSEDGALNLLKFTIKERY